MQFTVYRSRGRNAALPFVIDVTSDIIGEINRRIVNPLTPIERFSRIRPPERLNPILLLVDGKEYVLMTHETALFQLTRWERNFAMPARTER